METGKNPEDDFVLTITDELVKIEHPFRKTEQVNWQDIIEIKIITTDTGPLMPDVWLALIGKESGCLIPQGCNGFNQVYDIISKYKGFNFEKVIKAMSCTENEEFEIWKSK
jgi:hypothetical protein